MVKSQFTVVGQTLGLAVCLAICFVAAAIGAIASADAPTFYRQLARPSWSPPAYVFGPVWTTLYTLMAVSAWLIWRQDGLRKSRIPLQLFIGQLLLNAVWSWLFFYCRLGLLSFAEIVLLWAAILATLVLFWPLNRVAGLLLLPYLLWVSFAAVLNFSIWRLNPHLLGQ